MRKKSGSRVSGAGRRVGSEMAEYRLVLAARARLRNATSVVIKGTGLVRRSTGELIHVSIGNDPARLDRSTDQIEAVRVEIRVVRKSKKSPRPPVPPAA